MPLPLSPINFAIGKHLFDHLLTFGWEWVVKKCDPSIAQNDWGMWQGQKKYLK